MKENEETLKQHIDELQRSVASLTETVTSLIMNTQSQGQNQSEGPLTTWHSFTSQTDVQISLPFYFNSYSTIVNVLVEEGMGMYRQVTPAIKAEGQNIYLTFDRPYTGNVTIIETTPQVNQTSCTSVQYPCIPQMHNVVLMPDIIPIVPPTVATASIEADTIIANPPYEGQKNDNPGYGEPEKQETSPFEDDFDRIMGANSKWP